METTKKWNKISNGKYSLIQNEIVLGEIDRLKSKETFNLILNNETFKISSSGVVFRKLEISDLNGKTVLKMEPEKWYLNVSLIQFRGKTYKLIARNNPLFEYVIIEEKEELLAYGLDFLKENNKPAVRIIEKDNNQPALFHALLWYLFEPIAHENSGDFYLWMYGI